MDTRRVLTVSRDGGTVRALVVREEPVPAYASDSHVLVRVAWTVVDPGALGAGDSAEMPATVLGGTVEGDGAGLGLRRGDAVIGIGAPADLVALPARGVQPLPAGGLASAAAPLLPYHAALFAAVRESGVTPSDMVLISGEGLVAGLAARVVQVSSGTAPRTVSARDSARDGGAEATSAGDVDVLIDTTADPGRWRRVLPRVRREGRVVFLLPPGPRVLPFDFYPTVHRGSLSLVTRRVPSADTPVTAPEASRLLSDFLDRAQLAPADVLVDVNMEPHTANGTLIHLDALDRGRGLLVRWSGAHQ